MKRNDFHRILMVAKDFLSHLETQPEGMTLRESKRYIKGLLNRHGLDTGAYVYYDQMALDILNTASAIKLIMEPREPTRLMANFEEEHNDKGTA